MNITSDIKKGILAGVGATLIVALFFAAYGYFDRTETITTMSQQEAETVQGATKAADKAGVQLSTGQAKEVVTQIKEIRTTEQVPVYITKTTAAEAPAKIAEAKEQAKADYAIVTSKSNPDEKVDISKLGKDATIELNQYNIKAYPKVLREIEAGKSTSGGIVVGAGISRKISDNGQYVGLGVDYDTGNKTAYLKVKYTW